MRGQRSGEESLPLYKRTVYFPCCKTARRKIEARGKFPMRGAIIGDIADRRFEFVGRRGKERK